ncbi:TolB family protein [Bacillus sinesaloumensis]|uniref:TolB family protein n=1 Tax=Litchfieldia sinesaloumensis TaxID=1926280 RepID=UPI0009883822|nr:PD40 domain-containing protein [Bacillus sinesaloumensis]
MYRSIIITLILCLLCPPLTYFAEKQETVKASFLRAGDLWLLQGDKEIQITNSKNVYEKPLWSHDGKWLVYQLSTPSEFTQNENQSEVWVYHIETQEKKKLFYDGHAPTWSPTKNVVSFNSNGILNISDFTKFYNIATGVDGYTWLPDGSGFLLSTPGVLRPDGWSSATIYTKKVNENYSDIVLFGGVEEFFQLPREIGTTKDNQLIAVYADEFEYSPSEKWISFIVSPTASWSMDSNMLCVIDRDGKNFEVLDEVIFGVGKPKWAPSTDTLAFIAGGGRIVFGFKNKDIKVREMPASGSYTPANYADLDFDWLSNEEIVASRVHEQEWNNDFAQHPRPFLVLINLKDNKQTKITSPPEGSGDYSPQFVPTINKLVWIRGKSLLERTGSLWKSNLDGSKAEKWIENVDEIVFYNEK